MTVATPGLRRHLLLVTLFIGLAVAVSPLDSLPRLAVAVQAAGFAISYVAGGTASLVGLAALVVRDDFTWTSGGRLALGVIAALTAALLFRRAPRHRSEVTDSLAHLGCLVGLSFITAVGEQLVAHGFHVPDHGDVAFASLRLLSGLLIAALVTWRRNSERSNGTLFAVMLCLLTMAATQLFTVEFWQRQDDALLHDIADAAVAGFGTTLSDNLNTLSVKAATSETEPFTPDRFPGLMQTIVFGRATVGGAALVDAAQNLTVLSTTSQAGEQFDSLLELEIKSHDDAIRTAATEGLQTYLGLAVLPTSTGTSRPYFVYAFPLATSDTPGSNPRALVAALSISELLNVALVPTRAAVGEASVRLVDEDSADIGHQLIWSTAGDWFPTENSSEFPAAPTPGDVTGQVATGDMYIGDTSFHVVVERQQGLGSPTLFRRLLLTLETLSGLLVLGVIVANSNQIARRERERERREALLGAALEGAAGWTAIIDDTNHVVMANRGSHGVAAGALVTDGPLWREDDAQTLLAAVLTEAREGRQGTIQQVWTDPDDNSHAMRIFELEARPLPDPTLVYLQCVDVTENRNRAMRTAQSERMEAIGVLAGGLAHDFNNLLFITLGYLQMLERQPLVAGDPQANTYVRRAVEAVERGAVVAKSLLSFARSQPLAASQLNMNDFVANLRPLVEQALGPTHKLSITIASDDLNVMVDPGRLSSGVLNVVFNARDAMERPGTLEITISRVHALPPDAEVDTEPLEMIAIAISDTGKGLAPEVLARAFDPFFTTKKVGSGTGLGLSTVYSFAQQSGGWAGIASTEGKGATITIYLPAVHSSAPEAAGEAQLQTAATRALVVDDEPALADLVAGWLERFGMQTIVANTPQTAIRIAREFRPHLLVSDANLGDAIDGLELARLLVEQDPALMVVFMTGFSDRIKALQRAGVATLAKPFSAEDLQRTLSTHLGDRFAENARRDSSK